MYTWFGARRTITLRTNQLRPEKDIRLMYNTFFWKQGTRKEACRLVSKAFRPAETWNMAMAVLFGGGEEHGRESGAVVVEGGARHEKLREP
jgi:hypothetical protein